MKRRYWNATQQILATGAELVFDSGAVTYEKDRREGLFPIQDVAWIMQNRSKRTITFELPSQKFLMENDGLWVSLDLPRSVYQSGAITLSSGQKHEFHFKAEFAGAGKPRTCTFYAVANVDGKTIVLPLLDCSIYDK